MTTDLPKVVATNRVFAETRALFDGRAMLVAPQTDTPLSGASRLAELRDADGMMAFMTDNIDAALFAECPRLRVIGAALKGHDNIDLAAAERAGVTVCIVPDLLTVPTAEIAIGLMIALGRQIVAADREIRAEGFSGWRPRFYGTGIAGTTLASSGTVQWGGRSRPGWQGSTRACSPTTQAMAMVPIASTPCLARQIG